MGVQSAHDVSLATLLAPTGRPIVTSANLGDFRHSIEHVVWIAMLVSIAKAAAPFVQLVKSERWLKRKARRFA